MARKQFLLFGPLRLDPETCLLRADDELVSLEPMVARTLLVLARARGEPVDKDTLISEVWQDTVVTEASLARNVSVLNSQLRRYSQGKKCIKNIPKIGYRLLLEVTECWEETTQLDCTTIGNGNDQEKGDERKVNLDQPGSLAHRETGVLTKPGVAVVAGHSYRRDKRAKVWLLTATLAGLVLAGSMRLANWRHRAALVTSPIRLAVLPVKNLTGDPGREYVADGLTEEIISQLEPLNPTQLAVIARTSIMAYKDTQKTVVEIGSELQADYVLECSLRGWEQGMRISVQLITVHDQTHVWAKTYDRSQGDVLKLQSDIANAVARELSITFSSEEPMRVTAHPIRKDVYDLLLRGRYEWRTRKDPRLREAIDDFQRAAALDSSYGPAYADLAGAYAVLPYYSNSPHEDAFRAAKAAAEKALQLDETLWKAHTVLGLIESSRLNLEVGDHEYQRALQLNPNYATAHHWRSFCLWTLNRRKEALDELETARRLDPRSWIVYVDEALTLAADHQTDRAMNLLKTAYDSDPEFAEIHRALGILLVQRGEMPRAIEEARKAVEMNPTIQARATLGYVYGAAGKTAEAKEILAELSSPARQPPFRWVYLSFVYIGLGEKNEALSCLERAHRENSLLNAVHSAEVIFDPIRSDPRFLALLHRSPMVATSQ